MFRQLTDLSQPQMKRFTRARTKMKILSLDMTSPLWSSLSWNSYLLRDILVYG